MAKKFTNEAAIGVARVACAEPLEPYPGNMAKKWKCRCTTCGATIYPRMVNIERGSRACRYCYGPKPVDPKAAINAVLSAGAEPLEPYPGYEKPWRVRCKCCGHESTPMYGNIAQGQGACFRCSKDYGDLPAHVYLVHDPERKVVKVGISNIHAHRMTKYPGWDVVEFIRFPTGRKRLVLKLIPDIAREGSRRRIDRSSRWLPCSP